MLAEKFKVIKNAFILKADRKNVQIFTGSLSKKNVHCTRNTHMCDESYKYGKHGIKITKDVLHVYKILVNFLHVELQLSSHVRRHNFMVFITHYCKECWSD